MLRNLRARLLLAFTGVIVLAVIIASVSIVFITSSQFQHYVRHAQTTLRERLLTGLVRHYEEAQGWDQVQPLIEDIGRISGMRVIVADEEGIVVSDSNGELLGRPLEGDPAKQAYPITAGGRVVGTLYLAPTGRSPRERIFISAVNRAAIWTVLVTGAVGIMLTLWLSRRILRPVQALTSAARRMQEGDLDQRVDVSSGDELGELARAFNAMAAGLKRQEELRRQMVSDVAHELRTPLADLTGYLEALQEGLVEPTSETIASLREEALLLDRLVDDLQDLALAEAGQLALNRQPVALADVAERAADSIRPQAEEKGLKLGIDLPEELPLVEVDPQRIVQVLLNLLKNAVEHTPPGGEVEVSAARRDRWIEVRVSDTGEGIPPEDLPYIFERFYRADRSRARATGGAGLGLTISKKIIEAHGGKIWAESAEARGTTFTFTIPVAQRA